MDLVGGTFHRKEIEQCLDAACQYDKDMRNRFARDILLTYLHIETFKVAEDRQEKLKSLLSYCVAKRHEALQAGATSRSDPLWNVSACMEATVQLEFLATQDEDARSTANEIKRALSEFVDENLSPAEMEELRDLVLNSLND